MRFLLDTHAFLWAITDDPRLSDTCRQIFNQGANQLLLSVASIWEMVIKVQLGKLPLPEPAEGFLREQLSSNAIAPLDIQASHALRLFALPNLHNDPFDRMIIAQGQVENLPILTADPLIGCYPVATVW